MHGGKSLGGLSSPKFKTGKYSKYMPERLMKRYNQARKDTELLALRDDIALIDARLADLLGRVDTGESGELWRSLQQCVTAMTAMRGRDSTEAVLKFNESLDAIETLTREGIADYTAWHELGDVLEQRRKLVESEGKRLVQMQQTITAERAMLLIGAIGGIIRAHVKDAATRNSIAVAIRGLTDRPAVGESALIDATDNSS